LLRTKYSHASIVRNVLQSLKNDLYKPVIAAFITRQLWCRKPPEFYDKQQLINLRLNQIYGSS